MSENFPALIQKLVNDQKVEVDRLIALILSGDRAVNVGEVQKAIAFHQGKIQEILERWARQAGA